MAAADLYAWLIEATLATSAAALAVLALRKPLRILFGAGACRAAWSAVPIALLATWLPAAEADASLVPLAVIGAPIRQLVVEAPRGNAPDIAASACIAWLCGIFVFAGLLAWQQRRFMRGLGRIADRGDGLLLADAVAGLPAVVGVWKPRIVMPADAMQRYDAAERALMLEHERQHIARGDLLANACVAALRSLFWFNPLLHAAARRFRDDQELACDARVIARHPHARRAYGEAMLKTQVSADMPPLGCHWGQSHPLKERIEMLKRPLPSPLRNAGGRAIVVAILLAAGYAAWAAQPEQAKSVPRLPIAGAADFDARIEFARNGGEPARFIATKRYGETFTMIDGDAEGRPSVTASVVPVLHNGLLAFEVTLRIEQGGKPLAAPRLVVRDGQAASVRQGNGADDAAAIAIEVAISARDPAAAAKRARPLEMRAPAQPQPASAGTRDASALAVPPPVYPVDVAKQGITGRVVMIVDVAADGSVSAAKIDRSAGNGRLDAAALDAVRGWKFLPAIRNGKEVPSQVRVPVDFEMDRDNHARDTAPTASAMRSDALDWSSYDRMVRSLGARWGKPASPPNGSEC